MGRKLLVLISISLIVPSIASVQAVVGNSPDFNRPPGYVRTPANLSDHDSKGRNYSLMPIQNTHRFPLNHDRSISQILSGIRMIDAENSRQLEIIIGSDERQRVVNTTTFPNSAIANIIAVDYESGLGSTCTASFVGANVLLTAAHCLFVPALGGWPDDVIVIPGRNGEDAPFGTGFATNAWVASGWVSAGGNINLGYESDYGLILVPDSNPSDQTGVFTVNVLGDADLAASDFNPSTAGYPGDKLEGTQWFGSAQQFTEVTPGLLASDIDFFQGQSGSPVWRASDLGIVGIASFDNGSLNYAKRINQYVMADLNAACATLGCSINHVIESDSQPPSPQPTPTPTPPPVDNTPPMERTWQRTDKPIADGLVSRTWMWGPGPTTGYMTEGYTESPGGFRQVVYYDKSRMEITRPNSDPNSIWYVTNGLLVTELVTGRMQLGDNNFKQLQPAQIPVAGDAGGYMTAPTYATFAQLRSAPPVSVGSAIANRIDSSGAVTYDASLQNYGVTAAQYVAPTNHSVASVFWAFMNSEGMVYENGSTFVAPLFINAFYATGYPISEVYWTTVSVGGSAKLVLVQCFERRCLTYTPDNPTGWKVEAGNVGQHYYTWRYETPQEPQPPAPQPTPTATLVPTQAPAPQPTATATATPSPTPTQPSPGSDAPQEGEIIGYTNFEDWPGTTYDEGETYATNGAFHIRVNTKGIVLHELTAGDNFSDVSVTLDVRMVTTGGEGEGCLLFRAGPSWVYGRAYAFCLSNYDGGGVYALYEGFDSQGYLTGETLLGASASDPEIIRQWNRLKIIGKGNRLWFYVNGSFIGDVTHSGSSLGAIGVRAINYDTPPNGSVEFAFTNLTVRQLE